MSSYEGGDLSVDQPLAPDALALPLAQGRVLLSPLGEALAQTGRLAQADDSFFSTLGVRRVWHEYEWGGCRLLMVVESWSMGDQRLAYEG